MFNISLLHAVLRFRLAVLRKWRSKYGPNATYRNLANCFYSADKLDMVEAISQALGAPNSSLMGQEEEGMSSIFAAEGMSSIFAAAH